MSACSRKTRGPRWKDSKVFASGVKRPATCSTYGKSLADASHRKELAEIRERAFLRESQRWREASQIPR